VKPTSNWSESNVDEPNRFAGDPVDQFLDAPLSGGPDMEFRARLLKESSRLLHRRLRLRQAAYGAALVICYLAGLGTMRLGGIPEAAAPVPQLAWETPQPQTAPAQAEALPLERDPDAPAFVFERIANLADPEKRPLLFRLAGDRYLEQDHDEIAALRCYRRALDLCPDGDLAISANDNWLLIALKKARQEEKTHAKTTS
jgi:hypothetical protein